MKSEKEYQTFVRYEKTGPNISLFETMGSSLRNGTWPFIDLDTVKDQLIADLSYLILRKRFNTLRLLAKNKLEYTDESFQLDGHSFETLDEVQKALENKAFL